MEPHAAEAAARLAALRTPLSRIELAASRLARLVTAPAGRALADDIRGAVSELDDGLGRAMRDLVGAPRPSAPPEDCRGMLEALHQRIAPALHARGIDWIAPAGDAADGPILGNATAARQAVLCLLEDGLALAPAQGRIELALVPGESPGRCGVALRVHAEDGAEPPDAQRADGEPEAFAAARGFVHRNGGTLEPMPDPSLPSAVVWIEGGSEACAD